LPDKEDKVKFKLAVGSSFNSLEGKGAFVVSFEFQIVVRLLPPPPWPPWVGIFKVDLGLNESKKPDVKNLKVQLGMGGQWTRGGEIPGWLKTEGFAAYVLTFVLNVPNP
jgi:hypothetical protein